MSRQIIDLDELLGADAASGDFIPVEDVSVPRTKKMKITELAKIIDEMNTPVGSLYYNADVATNPATLKGFGTWAAWGSGRVPVGVDTGDTDFSGVEQVGGAKTHTLTTAQMPTHNHNVSDPGHSHGVPGSWIQDVGSGGNVVDNGAGSQWRHLAAISINASGTGISIANNGSGAAHNNMQPYITVYIWKRTA